jgi:hypothetical protein
LETAGKGEKSMSNSGLRNSQLLQQVGAHPLKAALAKCFDIAENFQGDVEFLQLDKNLSAEGRQNAMQAKLRAAIRDLRDAKAPIGELQAKVDSKRKAVAMPAFDQADVVGFLRRQELRAALRMANAGQRAMLLEDENFADSLLEQPAALSGLQPQQIGTDKNQGNQDFLLVEAVKKRRLESLFAPQLAEIDAMEKTIAEANMIADLARVDLQSNSGMDSRVFAEFVKPVESKQNAPWLRKDKDWDGNERTIVIDVQNHRSHVASEREILDGKFYRDHAEYLADRAAA